MNIILERKIHNATSTEGNIYIDGKWFCHTIEDVTRAKLGEWKSENKVYAQTAIPYGKYQVMVTWSNRFKRMLTAILNVPDFSGIRIHNGSTENSSSGCVIVSFKEGGNHNLVNDPAAMNQLCRLVEDAQKTSKVYIDIVDSLPTNS